MVVSHIREDTILKVGSLKVCTGQEAGYESLLHAMCTVYEDQSSEAVLLVSALNAFNSINRYVFLQNITIICPPLAKYVRNCYCASIRLFIIGGGKVQSMEGTVQGDSTAMAIYSITIIPLLLMLVEDAIQVDNCMFKELMRHVMQIGT